MYHNANRFFVLSCTILILAGQPVSAATNQAVEAFDPCQAALDGLANQSVPHGSSWIPFGGPNPGIGAQTANLMAAHLPVFGPVVELAIPARLEVNPNQSQQFADGQQNAFTDFGNFNTAPFVVLFSRPRDESGMGELVILFRSNNQFDLNFESLEVKLPHQKPFTIDRDETPSSRHQYHQDLSYSEIKKLGWFETTDAQPLLFRPEGWNDWFSVQFPQAYLPIDKVLPQIPLLYRTLPSHHGSVDSNPRSIEDPLRFSGSHWFEMLIASQGKNEFLFGRIPLNDRIHGTYLPTHGGPSVATARGGAWLSYREGFPFKIVYFAQDAREPTDEAKEGVVTGSGPHLIGARGEILVNSLMHDGGLNGAVLTALGFLRPDQGPNGESLAYRSTLTHQWMARWLMPDTLFVAPQWSYHWHMTPTADNAAGLVVWTPPLVPSPAAPFGFPPQ